MDFSCGSNHGKPEYQLNGKQGQNHGRGPNSTENKDEIMGGGRIQSWMASHSGSCTLSYYETKILRTDEVRLRDVQIPCRRHIGHVSTAFPHEVDAPVGRASSFRHSRQ